MNRSFKKRPLSSFLSLILLSMFFSGCSLLKLPFELTAKTVDTSLNVVSKTANVAANVASKVPLEAWSGAAAN